MRRLISRQVSREVSPPSCSVRSGVAPALPVSCLNSPAAFSFPIFEALILFSNISALVRGLGSSRLLYNMYSFQAHVRSTENGFLQSHHAVNTSIVAGAYGRLLFESDRPLDEDFYFMQSRASFVFTLDHRPENTTEF